MSLEENFRRFYSNFGIEHDRDEIKRLFDDIYHDDFKNELNGEHSLDKEQLWKTQSFVIKNWTASVLMFKFVQPNVVEYKIHFKGADNPVGKTIHCVYELMDGKIYHGRAVDKSSVTTITNGLNFQRVEKNAHAFFSFFDGTPKPFDDEMNQAFDALYHQDFVHCMDGNPLNKSQGKELLTKFAEIGTKMSILKFEPVDEVHFEIGIRVTNKNVDVVGYSRGTISGSMLLKIEPHDDSEAAYAMMKGQKQKVDNEPLSSHYDSTNGLNFQQVEKNAHALFSFFDGTPRPFDDEMNQAFDVLYHQDFVHSMDGKPINNAQWKERLVAFADIGTKISLFKFEPKDEVHFESGIRVTNKHIDVVGYSRGTISGSLLLKIEPHEDSEAEYAKMKGQKKEVVHSDSTERTAHITSAQ